MNDTKKDKNKPLAKTGKKPSFLKRIWQDYLKRLNKVTDGKPQCCK